MTEVNGNGQYGKARVRVNVPVVMRDGVPLATTVFLPRREGRYPTVLVRTAYNRIGFDGTGFTEGGMAFVSQDCRGRYGSGGQFYPFFNEPNDGWDTLDWIARQNWSNGRVGMFGDSYLGGTQLAVAPLKHPALVALNPRFIAGDLWQHGYYFDGAFSLALVFSWLCLEVGAPVSAASILPQFDVLGLLRQLPLRTLDEKVGCGVVPAWRDYIDHQCRDEFWAPQSYRDALPRATAPMLLTAGWYDYYAGETFLNYQALTRPPADPALAASHRVLVGPWTHGFNWTSRLGHLDFGPASLLENDSTSRWLDCILHGRSPADYQKAPIRIFVMGENVWRDEYEWPLQRTRFTELFLGSGGSANSLLGDGRLEWKGGSERKPDRYSYNPDEPVPTLGGNHSVGPYNPGLYEHALPGPYDQRPVERRDDMLVYTSDVLEKDLEVTGPVMARLFAASDAPDTDFVARLCDVYPDGRSINIAEGVLRARFRDRNWAKPRLLEPGQVCEYLIDLQATSNVFVAGHRIRLDVTSSNFPLWDRNLNSGEPLATGTTVRLARQTIHHDADYPSRLVLPVIAR